MMTAKLMVRGGCNFAKGVTSYPAKAHGMRTDRGNDRSSDFSAGVLFFLYRLGEPKTDRKVVNLHEDKRRELIRFKEAFIEGYGAFQDKARECGIEKIDFSIGVKHKKPDPPDFPSGRLFTVSPEDEWQIYRGFMLGENAKD